ncbi:MAG: hypothetical protein A2664_04025 [Candidatus Taylorbacteria bacterium RIFCSPHIGHO2_01_FULL_46_22b]|uniref:CAAX prenyl protease 1 N-terminal domain-containing protein n=1 Tax=Candidatus Taylorbacteria bacterium RIFCSPHIGHO2_01_FULL_46_22b TaxID=1802301 RepID=A0A1G2M3Y3_9BACT|nr:MAG: hypothetical protein A2664_04025 [Candidatus Taylorbacteria bacterium RIFCSPHIGHO2_01_FULL_46_22b]
MSYFFILPSYLLWHYTEGLRDMTRVWTNFLWFLYNFFSIPILAKTLFEPWRRIQEQKHRGGFSPEDIAETLMTNTIMRLVGALIRLCTIAIGTCVILVVFWGGILLYGAWLLLPALIPASFLYGLSSLIF